jgi:uncharacterized membrane protein
MICYWLGVMAVTIFGNIPLNNILYAFDVNSAQSADLTKQQQAFESRWNTLNTIRTIASIGSLGLMVMACIVHKLDYNN